MYRSLFKRPLLLVGPCGLLLVFLVLLSACAQSVSVPQVSARSVSSSISPVHTGSRRIFYAIDHDTIGVEWVGIPPGQLSTAQTAWLVFPAALLVDGPVRVPGILVPLTKVSVTYVWYVPTYYIGNIEDGEKVSPIDPNPAFPGNVLPNGRYVSLLDAVLDTIPGLPGGPAAWKNWYHQAGALGGGVYSIGWSNARTALLPLSNPPVLAPLTPGDPNQRLFAQLGIRQKGSLRELLEPYRIRGIID